MPKIIIHNAETNEIIEREMNDKELQDYNARQAEALAALAAETKAAAEKAALLTKLGITDDEAKLLLS
jgi:adenylate kinase